MNTTTAPVATTIVTPTAAKAAKQYTCGISERCKNEITEFRKGFTRPAAVKNAPPIPMSEKEALEILFKVATDRRFRVDYPTDDATGEYQYDGNGQIITITTDLVEAEWKAIQSRDYSENSAVNELDKRIAVARKFSKIRGSSDAEIAELIEKVKAKYAAEVAAAEAAMAEMTGEVEEPAAPSEVA